MPTLTARLQHRTCKQASGYKCFSCFLLFSLYSLSLFLFSFLSLSPPSRLYSFFSAFSARLLSVFSFPLVSSGLLPSLPPPLPSLPHLRSSTVLPFLLSPGCRNPRVCAQSAVCASAVGRRIRAGHRACVPMGQPVACDSRVLRRQRALSSGARPQPHNWHVSRQTS